MEIFTIERAKWGYPGISMESSSRLVQSIQVFHWRGQLSLVSADGGDSEGEGLDFHQL